MGAVVKITPICLDFETLPIMTRPNYPPVPVSFSLRMPEWKKPKFYAWAHKTGGNNCSREDAAAVLKTAYQSVSTERPLLCQNAKFDMDVAEEHFGLILPPWHDFHDTMFLLFLEDPHQRDLGLKPSAERILGVKPEEQDKVKEWILDHKRQLELDFPEIVSVYGGIKPSTAGKFIAYAPGNIVGPYADGDVLRTDKLFAKLFKRVTVERGMKEAYDRERRLLPILLRNEREGIRVDYDALVRDQAIYEAAQEKTDAWIRKALKAPTLDLNKDADMADALETADALTEWTYTATGRKSVSKKNMKLHHFRDRKLAAAYSYRQKCATILETFIRPWQHYTVKEWMHTNWNQVRQSKGGAGDTGGTRTGRPSTDKPNFLNVPRNMKELDEIGGFIMPTHIRDLPMIPNIRSYVLPDDKNCLVGRRDLNQQELRVLAHYEDGALKEAYLKDPRLDVHEFTRVMIEQLTGTDVGRSFTKTLNFGFVYGQGLGSLAEKLMKTVDEVKKVRAAQLAALPGFKALNDGVKQRANSGGCITTWGGRQYFKEPSKLIDGRMVDFAYKLLNYLVQGSSADITKEAIIRYDDVRKDGRLMISVYDEIDISVPKKVAKKEMLTLRSAMMSIELDVPLLSDGEMGPNFGSMVKLVEPEPDLSRWRL
jgi:DNA polymerase I-like protein with 3'-5' exonuclease and polymerase domains